jgi:glutathione-regulated potassium-efflux system ancillary protein KefG
MIYLPPFAVHGTHRLSKDEVEIYAQQYGLILNMLVNNEFEIDEIKRYQYLNDWLINMQNKTI